VDCPHARMLAPGTRPARHLRACDPAGDFSSLSMVRLILAMLVVGDCERVVPFLEMARDHTEELLRANWTAVDALATTLIQRHRMTGEEVRHLVTPLLPS